MMMCMGSVAEGSEAFTKEAKSSLYEHGEGIERPINALCDQCFFTGAIESTAQFDDRLVQQIGQVI